MLTKPARESSSTCAFWRSRSHVLGQDVSLADVRSWDVYHTPMMPLAELGISSTWSVRVCNIKCINWTVKLLHIITMTSHASTGLTDCF